MVPLWPDNDGWRPRAHRSDDWVADEVFDAEDFLSRRVADEVNQDPEVSGGRMVVTVQNGVVILEGYADTPATREAAGRRAWAISGVFDVCNMLSVDVHRSQD
jgi:osmotically-inducible protein OsmY